MADFRTREFFTPVHAFALLLVVLAGVMAFSRGQEVWQGWRACLPGLLGGGAVLAVLCRGRREAFLLVGIVSFSAMIQTAVGDPPGAGVLLAALAGGGVLGLGLAVLMRFLVNRYAESGKYLALLGAAAMGVLHLLMLANGGLWLRLGGGSLQLSEGLKMAVPLFVAGVLTWEIPSDTTRYFLLAACAAINLVCLGLVSELGTAVVVLASVWLMICLFLPLRYSLATMGVGTVLGLGACRVSFLMQEQSALALKIVQRITLFLHPEQADPLKDGYQQSQAVQALLLGGSLGKLEPETIPVASSDYILPACSGTFGCLLTLGVVAILCGFYALLLRAADRVPFDQASVFVLAGWFELVVSSLATAAGSMGLIPLAGIGIPLLSSGGSSLLISTGLLSFCLISGNFSRAVLFTGRRHGA